MATTTAFGWETPDDTDLVKDGAAAIRTLGSSIDTSMSELKGGTTGQVLSKTTGTDMDFTWTTPSVGPTYVAGKNGILNSNFSVAQRGTSFTAASVYTLDRWFCDGQSNRTISQVVTGDTTNLPFIQYAGRVQRNSGTTGTTAIGLSYSLETLDSIRFAGQTVTLSFYARAGANFSATSSHLSTRLYSGTGTNQRRDFSTGFTGEATPISQNAVLTTTWQRFSYSATVASTATELAVQLFSTPTGTAGANDYFEVTGVQLEIAASVSSYSPNASSYQSELAACQRYYIRTTNSGAAVIATLGLGANSTLSRVPISLPTTMRIAPTSLDFSNLTVDDTSAAYAVTAAAFLSVSTSYVALNLTHASGITQYRPYILQTTSSGGYLGFNAEL
jgi:hypothetical protein